jgi:hypothetical protein
VKKVLIVLGTISLALIVVVAVVIGYAAVTGSALDKQSEAYVAAAVPAIVSSWNEQEILSRASPEFEKTTGPAEVNRLFRRFRTLGRLQKCEKAQGQSVISITPETGRIVSAHYVTRAVFDAGEAKIEIHLVKHGDLWQIAGFKVNFVCDRPTAGALGSELHVLKRMSQVAVCVDRLRHKG